MLVGIFFKTLYAVVLWLWILPLFFRWRSLWLLFSVIGLTLAACMTIEVITSWQFQLFTFHHMVNHPSPAVWLNLVIYLVVTLVMVAVFFAREWIRSEKQKRELMESQLTSELEFLKSQINPHFLFNTLNNLFSIAQRNGQSELSTGISKLSGLMRYMIYDSKASHVPLSREISYLQDFIGLARLRFSPEEVNIDFSVAGELEGEMIAPMMFLPFVENAFKHGVQPEMKCHISISITSGKELRFFCRNRKLSLHNPGGPSGIGLENVRRRLSLLYPGKHALDINDDADYFEVQLIIRK